MSIFNSKMSHNRKDKELTKLIMNAIPVFGAYETTRILTLVLSLLSNGYKTFEEGVLDY